MEWKDTTAYYTDDKKRIPTSWRVRVGGELSIYVSCGHVHYRPGWIMHCSRVGIDALPLPGAKTKDQAQAEALRIVRERIGYLMKLLNEIEGS